MKTKGSSEFQTKVKKFNSAQLIYQEIFIGTLIYVAVLGLFNDYTNIVSVRSFSTILFSSIVLELLTFGAFKLKSKIISVLKNKHGTIYRFLAFFFVWLTLFLSKFVFIWTLNLLFGDYISIHGFFGILVVVLSVTIIHKVTYFIFLRLGNKKLV